MLVINREGKLFLGQRFGEPEVWQFPQGGAEAGLSSEENVLRELNEELGAPSHTFKILKKLNAVHRYDFSDVPQYAKGVWRGQEQSFWLVEFSGADEELNFELHTPEFMSYRWCNENEVRQLAEPKRLPGYDAPLKEYRQYLATRPKK